MMNLNLASMPKAPLVITDRAIAQIPKLGDAQKILDYYQRNIKHLKKWEPQRPRGFDTWHFWNARIKQVRREFVEDQSVCLAIYTLDQQQIIGSANFTHIQRGISQCCQLGYSVDQAHQGQGIMSCVLEQAIHYMFSEYKMHRIVANYKPENERSAQLLTRLGFEREGFARDFLKIDGHWADHVLTALINPHSEQD